MKSLVLCVSPLICCVALAAQGLQFEVVSIRPAKAMPMGQMMIGMNTDRGMLRYTNVALRDCIREAYRVKDFQVVGPDWLASERFDIEAKLPDGASRDQVPEMLQAMLADRFRLIVHRDTKEHAIYALTVSKSGPKLKTAEPTDDGGKPGLDEKVDKMPSAVQGEVRRDAMFMQMGPGGMHLTAHSITLANLAEMLSHFCERPVVDATGIEGNYAFELAFTPESMPRMPGGGAPPPPPGMQQGVTVGTGKGPLVAGNQEGPSSEPIEVSESIHDALARYGLKLEPRKAPMEVVMVDQVEKTPTEN
jgi:uncharacterized protein (TIGR03435 family)